jgi:uncharacterized protein (TIGR03435 family)
MKIQLATMLLTVSTLWGQSAAPKWQEFSIGAPTENHSAFSRFGIRAEGVPLKRVLSRAYGLPENRILGPEWIGYERYALTAIVADPKDFKTLLQQELTTLFHLLARRETRVIPVYVLKPLDGGAKLTAASAARTAETSGDSRGFSGIKLNQTTLAAFADMLGDTVGRPVIDETHMDDRFDIALNWKADSSSALKAAVKNQLGLDLADEQRAMDVLAIDHIEKLSFSK